MQITILDIVKNEKSPSENVNPPEIYCQIVIVMQIIIFDIVNKFLADSNAKQHRSLDARAAQWSQAIVIFK